MPIVATLRPHVASSGHSRMKRSPICLVIAAVLMTLICS